MTNSTLSRVLTATDLSKGTEAGKTWGGVLAWLEGVTCECGGGGRWDKKDQIFPILLFVQAPSKAFKVLSWGVAGSNLSSVKEWAGSAPSLLLPSGMFYL